MLPNGSVLAVGWWGFGSMWSKCHVTMNQQNSSIGLLGGMELTNVLKEMNFFFLRKIRYLVESDVWLS